MAIQLQSRIFRLAVLLMAVGVTAVLAAQITKTAYVRWCIAQATKDSLQKAIHLDPGACQAYNQLAIHYTFSLEDLDQKLGEDYSRRATECQPLEASYWITLAMALQAGGKTEESSAAAEKAASLEEHNSWILWRTANLQLVNGKTGEALSMFHRVLDGAPEFAKPTFASCWKATNDGELILQKVVPDTSDMNLAYLSFLSDPNNLDAFALRRYWNSLVDFGQDVPLQATFWELDRLIRTKTMEPTLADTARALLQTPSEKRRAEEERLKRAEKIIDQWDQFVAAALLPRLDVGRHVWERVLKSSKAIQAEDIQLAFTYFDALLRVGRSDEAMNDWDQLANQGALPAEESHAPGNLIVNGGFEIVPVNGGFDWRTSRVGGVYTEFDGRTHHGGARSLAVHFEGLNNLDFHHIAQVVPVKPNTPYVFSAFLKSRSLSGDAGPHVEIFDIRDPKNFSWETSDVTGTMEWTRYDLEFQTGPKTRTLVVRLRRKPGVGLNKRIEGTFWVDDMQLSAGPPAR
jgi:tetratricopeptide (TPR) repeat protein